MPRFPVRILARWGMGLMLVMVINTIASTGIAQQAGPRGGPAPSGYDPAPKLPSKQLKFSMDSKKWDNVFGWLTQETGIPVIASSYPAGSFSFQGPPEKEYSLGEIIDILNIGLLSNRESQKYLILLGQKQFVLIGADEKIDPILIREIPLTALATNPRTTELLRVTRTLNNMVAADLALELKPLLSPFGRIDVLSKPNQLLLTDTCANLRRLSRIIDECDGLDKSSGDTYSHKCLYITPRRAERRLIDVMGDPKVLFPAGSVADPKRITTPGLRPFSFTVDDRTNTLIVAGAPEKINQAKEILKQIDVPEHKGQEKLPVGPPSFKTYPVRSGNADALVKTLTEQYTGTGVGITALSANSIMVYATPADQLVIAKLIESGSEHDIQTKVFDASLMEPTKLATLLKSMYGDAKVGAPFIEADEESGRIIIRGTALQVEDVSQSLKAITSTATTGAGGTANMRAFTIDKGSAMTLAEAMQKLMTEMRPNPVEIITPDGTIHKSGVPQKTPGRVPYPMPLPKESRHLLPRPALGATQSPVVVASSPHYVSQPTPAEEKPAPVRMSAFGNRLIVVSDDPEMLRLAGSLVKLLTKTPAGEGDFEVIRLKYAIAADAAKVLDEAFNGPPQQQQQGGGRGGPGSGRGGPGGGRGGESRGGGGGFNPISMMAQFAGFGAQTPNDPRENRIRIVADTQTNSLLVRASPLDLLTIKRLLEKALDTGEVDSKALARTYYIELKNAVASEVLTVIQNVFKEQISPSQNQQQQSRGGFGSPFGFGRTTTSTGQFKNVSLTVGVDAPTNTIIVNCTEPLYKEIETLCKTLDEKVLGNYTVSKKSLELLRQRGVPEPVLVSLQPLIRNEDPRMPKEPAATHTQFRADVRQYLNETEYDRYIEELLDVCRETETAEVIQFIPLDGVDPRLVQQAVDAMQGRSSTMTGTSSRFGSSGFGSSRGSGFSQGGFGQSGFGQSGFGQSGFGQSGFGQGGFGQSGGGFSPRGSGGGFTPGGRSRGGRSGRTSALPGDPDFFVQPVKDDRQTSFVDPRATDTPASSGVHPVSYQEVQPAAVQPPQPAQPQPQPQPSPNLETPRGPVTIQIVGNGILVRGRPEDVRAIRLLIEQLSKTPIAGNVELDIVPLQSGDATSVTNILVDVFQRIATGTGSQRQQGIGGFGGGQGGLPGNQAVSQVVSGVESQLASVVMVPLPRFNAILVGATRGQMTFVKNEIKKLDKPTTEPAQPRAFALAKASAQRVAQLIQSFYATRYPSEPATAGAGGVGGGIGGGGIGGGGIGGGTQGPVSQLNQIRVTFDAASNTVFVQAAPADMNEIADLIKWVDSAVPIAMNDVRVVKLQYAEATTLATLLIRAITDAVQGGQMTGTGIGGGLGGGIGGGGIGGGGIGGGGIGGGGIGGGNLGGGGIGGAQSGMNAVSGIVTKAVTLRIQSTSKNGTPEVAGILMDVHVLPDPRTNRLLISAPAKSMDLIVKLIQELDQAPSARAEVKVFSLQRADATQAATLLQSLYLGRTAAGAGGGVGGGIGGGIGGGGIGGGGVGGVGGNNQVRPILPAISGELDPGATIIDIRLGVDVRTNSILAAGSANDMIVIEAILNRLDDSENIQQRHNEVYHLRNSVAVDVANALSNFFTNNLTVLQSGQQLNAYNVLRRQVVIVPEPITNKLLISATPEYLAEVLRVILALDAEPPQVMIQVLIASVNLLGTEEFGCEIGLQSPVLFQRGVGISSTTTNVTGSSAFPGFLFGDASTGLPQGVISPGVVGFQGLNTFGTGRTSSTGGPGGFVFAASSNTVSVLIRALKTQGRLDILSRPQVMTLDNQSARVFVGQSFPLFLGSTLTATGFAQPNVQYTPVGIEMIVTPKIQPDGRVLMRVTPGVSSVSPTTVSLGGGAFAQAIDQQVVDTTVVAVDGETVALGGLITERDTKAETKVPWLGDLPYLGAAFRFRTQQKQKQELLIIMTPHIVRNEIDRLKVLHSEASRMDWMVGNVAKLWDNGHDPILNPKHLRTDVDGTMLPQPVPVPMVPDHTITPILPPDSNGQVPPVVPQTGPMPQPTVAPPGQPIPVTGNLPPTGPIPGTTGQPQPTLPQPMPQTQPQPVQPQPVPPPQTQARPVQQLLPPVQQASAEQRPAPQRFPVLGPRMPIPGQPMSPASLPTNTTLQGRQPLSIGKESGTWQPLPRN